MRKCLACELPVSGRGCGVVGLPRKMVDMVDESSRDVAERAAGVLAPESDLFEDLDSAGFGEALNTALQSSLANPDNTARATLQWATDLARIPMVAATRWFGREIESPVPVDPKDRRFADPAWSTNPVFYGIRLAYLSTCRYARDVIAAASVEEAVARKAELALNLALDAMAPTNFLADEPGRPQAGVRHRGREPRQGRDDLPRRPGEQQAAGRARSTPAASRWAATSRRRRARSCSATS